MTTDHETTLRAARDSWLADDHDAALTLFRKAFSQRPDDLRLGVEVASYLGMRFEIDEATALLRRCELRLATNPAAMYQIGLAYERCYRPQEALRCWQRSVAIARQSGASEATLTHAMLRIVDWHERRGELDEAWRCLQHCGTASVDVTLWHGKLLKRSKRYEEAERVLLSIVHDSAAPSAIGIAAWYDLAELYEQRDDATQAFAAAQNAKRLQRPTIGPHLQAAKAMAQLEANFVASVTAEHFRRWQSDADHAPIALLTGPARSGTTLMCRILGMHEALVVSDEIEVYPTYLQKKMLTGKSGSSAGQALDSLTEQHLEGCRSLYWTWMSRATQHALGRSDASTGTAQSPRLLDKFPSTTFLIAPFRRLFPQAVIVVAIRDPRDIVVSSFLQHLPLNHVSAMFSRLDLTVARCCAELQAWLELKKKISGPWVEVRYEDVARGSFDDLRRVLEGLSLSWRHEFAQFQNSLQANPVRSPSYAQLREPITSRRIRRWELYRRFLEPHLSRLNDVARQLGYD